MLKEQDINNINTSPIKDEEKKINNIINSTTNIRDDPENEKKNPIQKSTKETPQKILIRNNYPTSIYSYFLISFGLFFLTCNSSWNEYGSSTISASFLIIGLLQYILGIYDFYQGYNYLSIQNIILGIRYMNFFLNYFELNGLKRTKILFSNMQGVIDFILFGFLSVFTIIVKGEGIVYFCIYFLFTLSWAFFILSGFADDYKVIRKITGYVLLITSICFWALGMIFIIHDTLKKRLIKYVDPPRIK